ncbi:MAG: uroporphyrinogen decarboxylase/cobalamine-independent methonine synthase family protein [Chloroflexota bacterium]
MTESLSRVSVDKRLERHRAFWRMDPMERPLLHVWLGLNFLSDASGYILPEGPLAPETVHFSGAVDLWRRSLSVYESVGDDAFRVPVPYYLMAWMEAILGLPVAGSSNTVWVQHSSEALTAIEAALATRDRASPWLTEMLRLTQRADAVTDGLYPNAGVFLRGPLDVLAGILGFERLSHELYDHPMKVMALADALAELTIEVGRAQLSAARPFQGEFFGTYKGVLAPGTTLITSADHTAMLSPRQFREYFLPSYRKVFAAFDYPCLHLHSGAVHVVDEVLTVQELRAIEFTMDPLGPPLSRMMPVFKRIQGQKPLIVFELSVHDLYEVADTLSSQGLFLSSSVQSVAEAQAITKRLQR